MINNYMRTEAIRAKIKTVMGWDIGDGDSVAFIKQMIGGNNKSVPLYIHTSRDEQVAKSAVAKTSDGTITIGIDADEQQDFVINFKKSPKDWNAPYSGATYRQHMYDYIRGVSEAILQNGTNRKEDIFKQITTQDGKGDWHWKKDEVLLVVGCPASPIWKDEKMRKQYEKLIAEATGISNVIVTEESRAAVFSLFEIDSLRRKIDLQTGVLVLDVGSSTADATYILPGKKDINISWELGAAQVEKAMLEYVLQGNKAKKELAKKAKIYDRKQVFVVKDDCAHAVFRLRLDKEAYFDGKLGRNARVKTMSIPIVDEDGDLLFDEDGEAAESPAIPYNVTDEMMQYALNEYEFDAQKNGVIVNHGTWKENFWQFLRDVKQTLEREKLTLQTVVVTGGGSQMPFTVGLSEKAFPGKVVPSDTPSHSVVRGLATIAYNEVKAPVLYDEAMENIRSDAKKNINAMIERIADNLSDKAYDAAVSAVNKLTCYCGKNDEVYEKIIRNFHLETNVGEITRAVNKAITDSLNRNVKSQIDNSMGTWRSADNEKIIQYINEASRQLYADKVMSDMIKISQADVDAISKNITLPNISMPDVAKDVNFIGAVVGYILSVVLYIVLAMIAAIVPGIGPIFTVVAGTIGSAALIDMLKEWEACPVTGGAVLKAVEKMKKNKSQKIEEIKEPVRKSLREAFTKPDVYGKDFEKHYMALMKTAEIAFDKILLQAEDGQ